MTNAILPSADALVRFYAAILPRVGHRCLAVRRPNRAPSHEFFSDDTSFIDRALSIGQGADAYHGCAVYRTPANRKGENVEAVKALWIDLDVGASKPYQTADEALAALREFTSAVGLSEPFVVKSGGGIHVYWALAHAVTPEVWKFLAAALAACMDAQGLKHDTSRTEDIASILRVPGTHNHKTHPPRPVTLVAEGAEQHPSAVLCRLKAYADARAIAVAAPRFNKRAHATNDLVGTREYLPSDAARIVGRCPTLHEVATTGGDVPYEVWWRAMGVAKFTSEPEATATHWTRNRENTWHAQHNWRSVMEGWSAGPTTCHEFAKHSAACASCKFNPAGERR